MALFLSDLHLGHPLCQAGKLINFIAGQGRDQVIYLVGDAVDDAAVKQWSSLHLAVLREILTFRKIVYLPGNHDNFIEPLCGLWGNVTVFDHGFYTAGDRKFLVTHGHRYDPTMPFVAPRWLRRVWPCTGRLHTKTMSSFLQKRVIKAAKLVGCDGVICGHSHHAAHEIVDGIEYLNCGDWFHSCTAVVEHDGEFNLIQA